MLKTLLSRVREYRIFAIITPLFMVGEVAMEVMIPALMGQVVDQGINASDMSVISSMSVRLVGAALLSFAFGCMGAWSASKASAGFARNIRRDEYRKVMSFSFADIDKFSTSSLITRMTTDVQNVQMSFQMMIRICVRAPIMFIFAMIMVWNHGGLLSLVFAVAIPVLAICIYFILSKTHAAFTRAFKGYDVLNRVVQENLTGIRTVKAYVREEEQQGIFDESAGYIRDNFKTGQKMMAFTNPLMMAVTYLCIIALSALGAKYISIGTLSTGQLLSIYTYTFQILMSLLMVGMVIVMLSSSWASCQRISEVLETEPSMDVNISGETDVHSGSIEFDHVSFGYKPGSTVLDDISLRIESGQMIGIIGPTGSGKTTLVSLIARLYDVTSGSVRVGGRDVREYRLESLRNKVAVVLQKNTLFTGTVSENLRWGSSDASDADIRRVSDIASVTPFISAMKDGFESHVDQGGANFSGGQRQRLCIARALLKSPRVLILDDSTSAVDTATDARIRRALREDVRNLTKIIISQRLSSVMDADQIFIMDGGRIVDHGTHAELLARNEAYRELYEVQEGGKNAEKQYRE